MRRTFLSIASILSLLLAPALALAQVKVQVVETDPPSPATLGKWENLYVRVSYESDKPIRVRAYPYYGGKEVPGMSSGSYLYPAGSGEAMYWIAYVTPAQVDRIVVRAEDDRSGKPIAQAEIAVSLTWTGNQPAATRARPEWVTRMNAEQARRQKDAYNAYMNRPQAWWEMPAFMLMTWSIPLYFVGQVVALWRLRGGWRIAAAVPAVPMALLLAHAIYAFFAGSNIFPLLLIFTCPIALVYLLVLWAVWRFRRQPDAA